MPSLKKMHPLVVPFLIVLARAVTLAVTALLDIMAFARGARRVGALTWWRGVDLAANRAYLVLATEATPTVAKP